MTHLRFRAKGGAVNDALGRLVGDPRVRFFFLLWAMTSLQFMLFYHMTGIGMSPGRMVRVVVGQPLWVLIPYILLGRRWKWLVFLFTGFLTVVFVVNSLYQPNFDDLATLKTILTPSGCNEFVIEGAIDTLSWRQPALVAPWLITLVVCLLWRKRLVARPILPLKIRVLVAAPMVAVLLLAQFWGVCSFLRRVKGQNYPRSFADVEMFYDEPLSMTSAKVKAFGLVEAYIIEAMSWGETYVDLAPEARARIGRWMARRPAPLTVPLPDNSGKNLIFIVAESLNTFGVERPGIAPCLESLAADPATLLVTGMVPQVGPGRSADGQFVYNTGLLPLTDRIMTEDYARARYPSIARALGDGYLSVECIGESAAIWNHRTTNLSYGFDELHDNLAGDGVGQDDPVAVFGADMRIFRESAALMAQARQPFFFFITSLTLHDPYELLPVSPQLDLPEGTPLRERGYLEKVRAFDDAVAWLLDDLKKNGLYDNSVIVIAADHEARQRCLPQELAGDTRLLAMILNSGVAGMRVNAPVAQADIFPTILDVMGKSDSYPWHGLGISLLRRSGDGDERDFVSGEEWEVSRDLIRSGYYREDRQARSDIAPRSVEEGQK